MSHLLDEASLDRQIALNADSDDEDWSSSDEGSDPSAPKPGDMVGVLLPSGRPSHVFGLVMTEDNVYLGEHDNPSAGVPVWICAPSFCGDPASLFRRIPAEHLYVEDRPVDVNSVVTLGKHKKGIVVDSEVLFTGTYLNDLLHYHARARYLPPQQLLSEALERSVKGIRSNRWLAALHEHLGTLAAEGIRTVESSGSRFVRANPFYSSQLIYSKELLVDDDTNDTPRQFVGHITHVDYDVLVELFLPPHPRRRSADDVSMRFAVIFDREFISKVIHDDDDESPKFVLPHCRNLVRSQQLDVAGDTEGKEELPSCAPLHVDAISPLMYVERITMETLQYDARWVMGSFSEYREEVQHRLRADKKQKKASRDDVLCNGIVLFAFPTFVTARDFVDGIPRDFCVADIVPVETTCKDNVIAGRFGFVLDEEDDLLVKPTKAYDEFCLQAGASPPFFPCTQPASVALLQWFVDHGILPTQQDQPWEDRLGRLYCIIDKLAVVTRTSSSATVLWRDSTATDDDSSTLSAVEATPLLSAMSVVNSPELDIVERNDDDAHDLFPTDVVMPSHFYVSTIKQASAVEAVAPDGFLFEDPSCPLFDVFPVQEYNTEFQVSESVRPRSNGEKFFVNGQELDYDPPFLGFISRVNHETKVCVVRWYEQPKCDGTDELVLRRPTDVGQIVELLPNTRVRVLWQDETLEDVPRCQLIPCRDFEEDEEDDEEDVWSDEDDTTDNSAQGAPLATNDNGLPQQQQEPQPHEPSRSVLASAIASLSSWLGITRIQHQPISDAVMSGDDSLSESAPSVQPPPQLASVPVATCCQPSFQSVVMFSSHVFEGDTSPPVNPTLFMRRIHMEWKRLSEQLTAAAASSDPCSSASIHVKVCTEAPSLMKFAVVGPMHTPYYQSFFSFDVLFPPEFPIRPPRLHFHSYGLRLNPNLYETGYVCLSLLGTWEYGAACEKWNPASSSVMQVLLSLQSLVLVKEPYYNEAGYEDYVGTVSGRRDSKAYSESVALLRIQHMIAMAGNPPADWVYLYREHFLHFAPQIHDRLSRLLDTHQQEEIASDTSRDPSITADGLVLPLTPGFVAAMRRALNALHACLTLKRQEWGDEDRANSLAHLE